MLCPLLTGQLPLLGHRTLAHHCPLSTDCSKLWETKEAYSSPLGQFPGDCQLPLQVTLSVTQVRLANSPCSSNTRLPWKPPTEWPIVIFSHWVLNSLQTVLSVTSCGCIVLILGIQDRWGHAEWNPPGLISGLTLLPHRRDLSNSSCPGLLVPFVSGTSHPCWTVLSEWRCFGIN